MHGESCSTVDAPSGVACPASQKCVYSVARTAGYVLPLELVAMLVPGWNQPIGVSVHPYNQLAVVVELTLYDRTRTESWTRHLSSD